MKRQFIDTFIQMKMDECDASIMEINEQIEQISRVEPYTRKGTDEYAKLIDDFHDLVVKRARLERSRNRLMNTYVRREMDALYEEFGYVEDFLKTTKPIKE